MLRANSRDEAGGRGIVDKVARAATALAPHRSGERYLGPVPLFADVVRAARGLRDALEKLIRQCAAEQGSWEYDPVAFLRKPPTSAVVPGDKTLEHEAVRLHSELSLGRRLHLDLAAGEREPGSLQVSIEALQCFLSTVVLLAEAPLKKSGRPADQERAFLDELVLGILKEEGLPYRAGEHAGFILAHARALAFGDTVDTAMRGDTDASTKTVSNLRYAARRKGQIANLERTVAQLSLAERAAARRVPPPVKK